MLNWGKYDDEFIDRCLDPATRRNVVRREERYRWCNLAFMLIGIAFLWNYGFRSPNLVAIPLMIMIVASERHARTTANLRLAKFAEAIAQRISPR